MEHFDTIKEVDTKNFPGITTDPNGWKNPMIVEIIKEKEE